MLYWSLAVVSDVFVVVDVCGLFFDFFLGVLFCDGGIFYAGEGAKTSFLLITLLQGFLCDEVYVICCANCSWHCCLVLYAVMHCFEYVIDLCTCERLSAHRPEYCQTDANVFLCIMN